jgi:aerobic-type carbon monoxide dehydrogenase small subunit (CoxS/CutS family)
MKKIMIQFSLNGVKRVLDVEPNDTLLDVLRTNLGIKSPKIGCDRGDCGTCTIFMDGKTVRSCLVLAAEADGCEIVTLEGLSQKGPTPLQKAFLKHNSFQCGFCAPGVILSAEELLRKKRRPSREEIQAAIAGNLCRCTGYSPIIDAVEEVARR